MYWLVAMAFVFLQGTALLRMRSLRRLVPAGMTGLLLAGLQVGLPQEWMFLRLVDSGPISGNTALTLLVQSIGGPVAAMWFAQGLGATFRGSVVRILQFSAISLAFYWMAVEAGKAIWWGPFPQMAMNTVGFTLVCMVHLYCQGRLSLDPRKSYGTGKKLAR